ncbi:MAG TPA: DUF1707 and DUF4190 domain-containing protein [Trebonia sp.]|nr:DUF1707 and DUF4190 domain-containing protein [Trebonia sp.]
MTSDPGPSSNDVPLPPTTPLTTPMQPPPQQTPPTQTPPQQTPHPPAARAGYGPPSYGPAPYSGPPVYPPYPYGPHARYVQPGMLAAAADRERTMDVLKAAFMEGRLTKGEFDERSARALTARTYGDLNLVVADLPSGPGGPAAQMMPYQQAYYSPIMIQRTNGFAIGALVCGIVPFFGGIPAIILGHVARGQIRRSGDRGDGMAIAGLVLGYLWVSLWVLILLFGIAHS